MKTRSISLACSALLAAAIASTAPANDIASFADPMPNGGGTSMFFYYQGTHGFYGGWAGPPGLTIETPLGTFTDCTMHCYPMYIYPTGVIVGGQITFYLPGQVQIFQITFSNGFADTAGFRCGPSTGGSVQFAYSPNGVQLPAGLTEPLQGPWFNFEFHNQTQGPRGPEWTASFTCGAVGTKGDMNCDGAVSFADINVFVQALADPTGYATAYPWCALDNGDINADNQTNFADINPFVALLTG